MNLSFFAGAISISLLAVTVSASAANAEDRLGFEGIFDRGGLSQAMKTARDTLSAAGVTALDLAPRGLINLDGISSYRFQQSVRGVEVLGGITVVETGLDGNRGVVMQTPRFEVNTIPTLTAQEALRVASAETGLDLTNAQTSLKILPEEDRSGARLIHWVEFPTTINGEGGELIIDAHSGDILARMTKIRTLAPIHVYSAKDQGKSFVVNNQRDIFGRNVPVSCLIKDLATGGTETVDIEKCSAFVSTNAKNLCQLVDGDSGAPYAVMPTKCAVQVKNGSATGSASASARRAAENSRQVLKYYFETHGRDSFDGKGTAARSLVQVGLKHANAAWVSDMGLMMYGEGDGETLGDFTESLDVAGHEMTHGVISRTAKFINRGESGALDEGYADFFGLMIADNGSWVVGKDIFLNGSGKGIRDLRNPSSLDHHFLDRNGKPVRRAMPKHVKEKFPTFGRTCGEDNDRCYVHGNSTILGHALYQVHQAIGRDRGEKVIYQGLTRYLSESSNLTDAAAATFKACSGLYDAVTCSRVKKAFSVVGL